MANDADPHSSGKRPQPRPWAVLLGALAVIALLVGGAVWMLLTALRTMTSEVAGDMAAAVEEPAVALAPGPGEAAAPETAPEPLAPAETTPAPLPGPEPVVDTPPPEETVVETVIEPEPELEAGLEPVALIPTVPDEAVTTEAEPVPAPERKQWPLLKVTGVVGKGQWGSAVINGKVVAVGELISGTRLVSVDSRGVELRYEGESRSVRVGGTTER